MLCERCFDPIEDQAQLVPIEGRLAPTHPDCAEHLPLDLRERVWHLRPVAVVAVGGLL